MSRGAVSMQGLGRGLQCAGRMAVPSDCVQIPEGLAEDRQHWQGVAENSDRKGDFVSIRKFTVAVAEGDV